MTRCLCCSTWRIPSSSFSISWHNLVASVDWLGAAGALFSSGNMYRTLGFGVPNAKSILGWPLPVCRVLNCKQSKKKGYRSSIGRRLAPINFARFLAISQTLKAAHSKLLFLDILAGIRGKNPCVMLFLQKRFFAHRAPCRFTAGTISRPNVCLVVCDGSAAVGQGWHFALKISFSSRVGRTHLPFSRFGIAKLRRSLPVCHAPTSLRNPVASVICSLLRASFSCGKTILIHTDPFGLALVRRKIGGNP